MRIGIYARVSTQRQAQADGLTQQLERLQAHALQQGWDVAAEHIFRDDGYSGASLTRPGLERLRDQVAMRQLDGILITAPDRLARNYVHQVLLLEEITATGCQVQFLDRPMNRDPHDQLLLQIRGAVAEYERSLIAERMRRGRLRKLQAGILLPWTKPPYGYCVDSDHPRDPAGVHQDPVEAAAVAAMFVWYADQGRSLYSLAKKLHQDGVAPPRVQGRWNVQTLRGILTNPVYTGEVYAGRIQEACGTGAAATPRRVRPREDWITVASIPAIVSQEQFERVQDKLAQNRQFARRNNTAHAYLLRALVSCGVCGLSCQGRCLPSGYSYYCCRGKLSGLQSHRPTKCPSRYIPVEQVDALVWQDLCRLLNEPEAIRFALERAHGGHWLPQDLQARRQALRRGRASVQQQIERLTEAYLASIVSLEEYRRRRHDLEQKAQSLAGQVEQLEAQVDRQAEIARLGLSLDEFCRRVREGLDRATWEQKRQLIEWLVVRVIVTDGEVEIRYAIPTSSAGAATRFCQLRADYRAALGEAQGVACRRHPLRENRLIVHEHPPPRSHSRLDQELTGCSASFT
jgi:site-specific DNA recombinase